MMNGYGCSKLIRSTSTNNLRKQMLILSKNFTSIKKRNLVYRDKLIA